MDKIKMVFNKNEVEKMKIYLNEILLDAIKENKIREQIYISKLLSKIQAFEDVCEEKIEIL